MAKRSPMATGGEGMGSKPARQGPGGLSPKLKGALKAGGKMAAEELFMAMVPVARLAKLKKVLDGLGKGASRSEVATALKKNGFDKYASTKPSRSEIERGVRNAEAREQAAANTRQAKRDVKFSKRSRERDRMEVGESRTRDKERRSKAIRRQVRQQEDLDKVVGRPPVERSEAMRQAAERVDANQSLMKNPEVAQFVQRKPTKGIAKNAIRDRKKLAAAEKAEKQINKLADLSDTIAKNAPKRKKEIRKALRQESKPKASERPIPPAPVGTTPKRTEGLLEKIDPDDIPELYSRVRKMRGPKNAMTTSPRGGDMTVEILPNDLMLVTDPKTQTTQRFRGKVHAGGKVLEWVPDGGLPRRFNRRAIQEINDKFGVNLIPKARVQKEMRKAAEAKAKK